MTAGVHARIVIEFSGWWLAGTGGGHGRRLDAACHRDGGRDGYPAMPMSQVKGVLRETADRLADLGAAGWSHDRVLRLFGKRPGERGPDGAVAFLADAVLPASLRGRLRPVDLFDRVASTAIDESGVADDRTLRAIETAAPFPLEGALEWIAREEPDADWIELLDATAAATLAFGAGKNDGYGAAVARVEPTAPRPRSPAPAVSARRLRITLRPTARASFSARAATEGAHRTLMAPPGAALLGWAAAAGPYDGFDDPFAVFHGGAVRFGDASPIVSDGEEALPAPKLLVQPKNAPTATEEATRLGRPRAQKGQHVQYEELKDLFVTPSGVRVEPEKGQRLRTATKAGRAKTGGLFGCEHLEPTPQTRFVADLEIDDTVSHADVARLIGCFAGRTLRLGRARGASYGGGFETTIGGSPTPTDIVPAGRDGLVRVLVLSDLALCDRFGAPTARPEASLFGLMDGVFSPAESAASLRRYAPWNAHLGCRDIERVAIEAGSVLAYTLAKPLPQPIPARLNLGLWREAGLGRVWIDPPFLRGETGSAFPLRDAEQSAPVPDLAEDDPDDPDGLWIAAWRRRRAMNRVSTEPRR